MFKKDNKLENINYYFTSHRQEISLHNLALPPNQQFSQKRLSDFYTGRYCAIKALEQLGINDVLIPIGEDRAPVWPKGIVGSISHCDSLTGAIVAKNSDHISLGLDIEEIGRVTPDLWDLVFTKNEKRYLSSLSEKEILIQSTSIFSIKEAFYKFQYPLTNTYLEFLDVEVELPTLIKVNAITTSIIINSLIKKNRLKLYIYMGCVIAVVTSSTKF